MMMIFKRKTNQAFIRSNNGILRYIGADFPTSEATLLYALQIENLDHQA